MKRKELIRHLEAHGCEFLREASDHTVYVNRAAQKASTIPRHREINDFLARKICRDSQFLSPELYVEMWVSALWLETTKEPNGVYSEA